MDELAKSLLSNHNGFRETVLKKYHFKTIFAKSSKTVLENYHSKTVLPPYILRQLYENRRRR